MKKIIKKFLGERRLLFFRYKILRERPSTLRLDITAYCNAKCPFCPRTVMDEGRMLGSMDTSKAKKVIEQARAYGIRNLKLYITSEPLMHKDFKEIVLFAKKVGLKVFVSTNASVLHKHFDNLALVDSVQFSIEGWDKASYEKYRTPLKFDRVYDNIKQYVTLHKPSNQETFIHLPLTRKTELKKFFDLWGPLIPNIRIDFMQPANTFNGGKIKTVFNEQLDDEYFEFEKISSSQICYDPFSEVTVAFDGKIMLCCLDFNAKLDLGSIENGFAAAMQNSLLKTIQKEFYSGELSTCDDCSQFYRVKEKEITKVKKMVKDSKNASVVSNLNLRFGGTYV